MSFDKRVVGVFESKHPLLGLHRSRSHPSYIGSMKREAFALRYETMNAKHVKVEDEEIV